MWMYLPLDRISGVCVREEISGRIYPGQWISEGEDLLDLGEELLETALNPHLGAISHYVDPPISCYLFQKLY